MKIFELFDDVEPIEEAARNILGRTKTGIKRKFRCTSGPRKGRIVADPATCVKPIDVAKRVRARATRAKKPGIASFKRSRTLRSSPVSKIIKKANIARAGKTGKMGGIKKRTGIKARTGIKRRKGI
tara:strand:- start:67 stop:444 length:378 start_codon:yes stop_codon:yes gene_type:complete